MTDLPDVNVLVAAHLPDHEFHADATTWLDGTESFATTPYTEAGMVRNLLNPVLNTPLSPADAHRAVDLLRTLRGYDFWPDDQRLGASAKFAYALSGHNQVTDLHLLELAASRGGRLVTFDAKIAAPLRTKDRRYVRVLGQPPHAKPPANGGAD
jgi:toxin-antitoxin system PIN domain toxin